MLLFTIPYGSSVYGLTNSKSDKDLGKHLMSKFVVTCNRNLLQFFSILSNEYRFFLLHQIKTNDQLYYPS